jgi:tRNA G46 methylase TrmB
MVVQEAPRELLEARAVLAREWAAIDPQSPDEVLRFYQQTPHLADDLDAWHRTDGRQAWTQMLVHVARTSGARCVVDIGCGAGHDLAAIGAALPADGLHGVEPNHGSSGRRWRAGRGRRSIRS